MHQIPLNSPALYAFANIYHDIKNKTADYKSAVFVLASLLGKNSVDIILADDDAEDRAIFLEVVQEIMPQLKVTMAEDGEELMKILKAGTVPDIIFLDLNMPLKNGQECLEEIRNSRTLKDIPVIIYSTSTSPENIDATYKKGANFYLPKPHSFREFKTVMSKILSLDLGDFVAMPPRDKFLLGYNRL